MLRQHEINEKIRLNSFRRVKWASSMLKSDRLRLLAKGVTPTPSGINTFIKKDIKEKQKGKEAKWQIPEIRKALHNLEIADRSIDRKKVSDTLIHEAQAILDKEGA